MMEEQNFLRGYEVSGLEVNKRMYKIVALATVLMIAPLLALSQTSLLSKSACESAFVNSVCQVLDTVYIGSKMLARNKDYVDREYDQPELADAKVIWTEIVENQEPPLEYPQGYFLIANPEDYVTEDDANLSNAFNAPPIARANPTVRRPSRIRPPARRSTRPSSRKPKFPKANPNKPKIDDGATLGDMFGGLEDDKDKEKDPKKGDDSKSGKPKPTPKVTPKKQNEVEEKSAKTSDDVKAFNRRPIEDLADLLVEKADENKLDLSKNFRVSMKGSIDEEGMLIAEKSGIVDRDGDAEMIALAEDAFGKVGRTGWLSILADNGASKIEMVLEQNDEAMLATVQMPYADSRQAKAARSAILLAKKFALRGDRDQNERILLEASSVGYEGNMLVLTFKLEKDKAQALMDEGLKSHREWRKKNPKTGKPAGVSSKPADSQATSGR